MRRNRLTPWVPEGQVAVELGRNKSGKSVAPRLQRFDGGAADFDASFTRKRLRYTVGRRPMDDALYVGLALVFFVLTFAFVKLCERV
jgi:hypothetical protein